MSGLCQERGIRLRYGHCLVAKLHLVLDAPPFLEYMDCCQLPAVRTCRKFAGLLFADILGEVSLRLLDIGVGEIANVLLCITNHGIVAPPETTGDDIRLFAVELMNRLIYIKLALLKPFSVDIQ